MKDKIGAGCSLLANNTNLLELLRNEEGQLLEVLIYLIQDQNTWQGFREPGYLLSLSIMAFAVYLYLVEFWFLSVDQSVLLFQLTSQSVISPGKILEEMSLHEQLNTITSVEHSLLNRTSSWEAASLGISSLWVRFQFLIQSMAQPLDQLLWLSCQALENRTEENRLK